MNGSVGLGFVAIIPIGIFCRIPLNNTKSVALNTAEKGRGKCIPFFFLESEPGGTAGEAVVADGVFGADLDSLPLPFFEASDEGPA